MSDAGALRWPERLLVTQASLGIREPLLSLRRQLADILVRGR